MLPRGPVKKLITSLKVVHDENAVSHHYYRFNGYDNSSMYLTLFVYQFFLYNSLYQIDWERSFQRNFVLPHMYEVEAVKQKAFESFIGSRATCDDLVASFSGVPVLQRDEDWIEVVPDAFISAQAGKNFFARLRAFQERLRRMKKKGTDSLREEALKYIPDLRDFMYVVRCNIFHGRKSIADARDPKQNKRLEVYFLFLSGLVRLFFACCSRSPVVAVS
jgi:hypothetical protein